MQNDGAECGALSLLTPIGYQSGDCGYCKEDNSSQRTPNSRASYYARSTSLCPRHYQILMDRGWRRSGNLLYIPDASRSCCPHYTIRLPASALKPSRDQRQTLNRWNRFVLGEKYAKEVAAKYPKSKAEKQRENSSFDLVPNIHESELSQLKPGIEPEHKFEVTLEPDDFSEEKYKLFDNYQRHVHHEGDSEISRVGFKRFLCSSPLHRHSGPNGRKYGSHHMCYRLDGRLVALGVLDLLPHAVSGVYFLYHSDFEKWSFGKLSALREAGLALEQGYQYYYMGYYIHACQKMRYKGDYKPQYVLDYHTGGWDVLDNEMRAVMDRRKYASMSKERARNLQQSVGGAAANGASEDELQEVRTLGVASAEAEYERISHPVPREAFKSRLSLLVLGMPGVLTLDEVREKIDLDLMSIHVGRGGVYETQDLVGWHTGSDTDAESTRGIIAEFAAAIGPEAAKNIIVDFSRG